MHPKGGVGRNTTIWQLGAELALRGKCVVIEDLDQGAHLSHTFGQYPLGLPGLQLATAAADVDEIVRYESGADGSGGRWRA
jgi:cellulose biosynthesis protein BcsQ